MVRVYPDCDQCDRSFLRRTRTFVNYIHGRKQADVRLMGTAQQTGGGDPPYCLEFFGQGPFQGLLFELTYEAPQFVLKMSGDNPERRAIS